MQNSNLVVVLGTGGTIAGVSSEAGNDSHYKAAQLSVEHLLASVPDLVAPLECEQVAQLDSKDMGYGEWLRLARRVMHHLSRPQVVGVVITHGTDTLEETAYFLQRVLSPRKPVVMVGAMRPATSSEADGPGNLRDGVLLARTPDARGVLAVHAGVVFSAHDLRKVHATRIHAFSAGDAGPVAHWDSGHQLQRLRTWPVGQAALGLEILPEDPGAWPRVEMVMSHAGATGEMVRAVSQTGLQGWIAVGTGNGTLHAELSAALRDAQAAGIRVVRATRCGDGLSGSSPAEPFPSAGTLTAAQARIELMLHLMMQARAESAA